MANTSFNGFHCDGKQGICDIDNANRSSTNTKLVLNQNNTLTLSIARNKLSSTTEETILGVNHSNLNTAKAYYFTVPTAYVIPQAIQASLSENNSPLSILKGTYPISISEDMLTIIFKLQ